jgi:hypothetical protein
MGVVGFIPYDSPPMQKNSGRNKFVTTLDRGAREQVVPRRRRAISITELDVLIRKDQARTCQ